LSKPGIVKRAQMRDAIDAQLTPRFNVDTFNKPEGDKIPETIKILENSIHHEEDCTGTIACFHAVPCGFLCAGCNSHRATASGLRASWSAARSWIRVDQRLSPLRRRPLRMDPRPLGSSAPGTPALGGSQMETPWRSLGDGRRALAVDCNFNQRKERGVTDAPLFPCLVKHLYR